MVMRHLYSDGKNYMLILSITNMFIHTLLEYLIMLRFFCWGNAFLRVSSQRLAPLSAGFRSCLRTASYHRCLRSPLAASTATRKSLCCVMLRNGFHDAVRHFAARPLCWGRFPIAALFQCSVLCFSHCSHLFHKKMPET